MRPALNEMEDDAEARLAPSRLAAANIHPRTRLATDYLNHYNAVVMLLELVPAMPDCVDEVIAWRPAGYADYFRASHFREKDLAVEAYHAADRRIVARFDAVRAALDAAMGDAQGLLRERDPADPETAFRLGLLLRERLQPLLAEAAAIVNGAGPVAAVASDARPSSAQATVDRLFP